MNLSWVVFWTLWLSDVVILSQYTWNNILYVFWYIFCYSVTGDVLFTSCVVDRWTNWCVNFIYILFYIIWLLICVVLAINSINHLHHIHWLLFETYWFSKQQSVPLATSPKPLSSKISFLLVRVHFNVH